MDLRTVVSNPATITARQINPSPDAQADSHLDTITVVNKIVPLSLSVTPLPPPNITTHKVSGTCDFAFGEVAIKIEEPTLNLSLNTSTTCVSNNEPSSLINSAALPNTFSINLNIGRSLSGDIPIELSQDPRTASFPYTLISSVPQLALNSLDPLNSATANNYTVTGVCDFSESLKAVTVNFVQASNITGTSDCQNDNTFSITLQAESLSVTLPTVTVLATHGNHTVDSPLKNSIVPLEIDRTALVSQPLNLASAATYTITGSCDPSLGRNNVEVTMGTPNVTQTTSCDGANNKFSIDLDASSITSDIATITVTHGPKTRTANVPNKMAPLSVSEADLSDFNLKTAASYRVAGKCDFSLIAQGSVTVLVVEAPTITGTANCASDNTFYVDLDAVGVPDPIVVSSLTFQVSYAGQTITTSRSISNDIVRLSFSSTLPALNLSNASSYPVTGKCDSSLGVTVEVSVKDISNVAPQTVTCQTANDTFSVSFDLSGVPTSTSSIVFQASYGNVDVNSAAVANEKVPLLLDNPPALSLSNASSYPVTGKCDASLGVSGTITIGSRTSMRKERSTQPLPVIPPTTLFP